MKQYLFVSLFVFASLLNNAKGETYYVRNGGNNDQDGKSDANAWADTAKVNAMMKAFKPGDAVLFRKGDVFYGSLQISASGQPDKAIVFGSYGDGDLPVFKGANAVTGWTQYRGKIWMADVSKFNIGQLKDLYLNGIPRDLGRTPNYSDKDGGFRKIENHAGSNTITSSELSKDPNWVGATAIFKPDAWSIERETITRHAGDKIVFRPISKELKNGFGYFIQNSIETLDTEGEWFLDASKKRLFLCKGAKPADGEVEVAQLGDLVTLKGVHDVVVENVNPRQSGGFGLLVDKGSKRIVVRGCRFERLFLNAIKATGDSEDIAIHNNEMLDICNGAFHGDGIKNLEFTDNHVKNVSLRPGMMGEAEIRAVKLQNVVNAKCEYNKVENTGHNAFTIGQIAVNIVVRFNECVNWKLRTSDGGALYSTGYKPGNSVLFERNICHDAVGSAHGARKTTPAWNAVYADNNSQNVTFKDNTVFNIRYGNAGFFQQGTTNCRVIGNKFIVRNSRAFLMPSYDGKKGGVPETNNELYDNVFFTYGTGRETLVSLISRHKSPGNLRLDRNAYCSPFTDYNKIISGFNNKDYSLKEWQDATGQDAHSAGTPGNLKKPVSVFFEVNISKENKTVAIPAGQWVDPFNKARSGTITLEPYTSILLLQQSAAEKS